ncbi:hypothetical protein JCM11641_003652, partial [Rhodosporidiobolus odoratus]
IEGQAAEWATREIQRDLNLYLPEDGTDLRQVASPWPLDKIRDELSVRFVNQVDHIRADVEWDRLRQEKRDGTCLTVAELDITLLEIAERMSEATPMQRKKKFVKALRPDIAMHLHREKRTRDWDKKETILYRDLVREARNIEQALNLVDEASRGYGNNYGRLASNPRRQQNPPR